MRKNQRIRKKREAENERRRIALLEWHAEIRQVLDSVDMEEVRARVAKVPESVFNREYQLTFPPTRPCESCDGSGMLDEHTQCWACGGTGEILEDDEHDE